MARKPVALASPYDEAPLSSDIPSDRVSLDIQIHSAAAAHQLSASICTGAFTKCTPAERQQLHALAELMAKPARGTADFAYALDSAAHQLATFLIAGGFAGCIAQERMQLHMLPLFLVELAEHAQALTARPRPTSQPVQAKIMAGLCSAPGDRA